MKTVNLKLDALKPEFLPKAFSNKLRQSSESGEVGSQMNSHLLDIWAPTHVVGDVGNSIEAITAHDVAR